MHGHVCVCAGRLCGVWDGWAAEKAVERGHVFGGLALAASSVECRGDCVVVHTHVFHTE